MVWTVGAGLGVQAQGMLVVRMIVHVLELRTAECQPSLLSHVAAEFWGEWLSQLVKCAFNHNLINSMLKSLLIGPTVSSFQATL